MTENMAPQLLNSHQAADTLAISVATLKRLIRAGELPAVKIGHCLRFHPADLAAFVDSRRKRVIA